MPHPKNFLAALALAVGLLAAGIFPAAAAVQVGDAFPDLATFSLEGKLPADCAGKIVIVDFWASWCKPCKMSFPALNELQARYAAQGVVIIAINEDEKRADMEAFLKKLPATFTVVRDAEQKLVRHIKVNTMPSSFVIDRTGKVRFAHSGFHGDDTKQTYITEIESLLTK
ncbi:MAG: TlpA disulfide reductase family protein [Verrucomicrobia bacterium]|nr:TlpA disulfide reductase family protein [Verrucomicrobiota bacterium]